MLMGFLWYNHSVTQSAPPLLKADSSPKRIKPEKIDNEIVADNDSIYDTLKNPTDSTKAVNLIPEPETPIQLTSQKTKQEEDIIDNIISNLVEEIPQIQSENINPEPPIDRSLIDNNIIATEKNENKALNIVTIPDDTTQEKRNKVENKPSKTEYYIQIASTRTKAQAIKEWSRISKSHSKILSGLEYKVVKHELNNNGVFFQVLTGPIKSSSHAKLICKKLINAKQNCLIKRM